MEIPKLATEGNCLCSRSAVVGVSKPPRPQSGVTRSPRPQAGVENQTQRLLNTRLTVVKGREELLGRRRKGKGRLWAGRREVWDGMPCARACACALYVCCMVVLQGG